MHIRFSREDKTEWEKFVQLELNFSTERGSEEGTMEGVHHIVPTDTKVSEKEGDNNVS